VAVRLRGMATWQQFEEEAPDLAKAVRERFEATKHHVLATLRRDGSPRVSGTEVRIYDGDLTVGSMWGAVKARDLQRDGRFALHANPGDGSMAAGDAKVAGVAVEVVDQAELDAYADETKPPPGSFHFFRLFLTEVVLTTVENNEYLLIRTWRPGEPVKRVERR
jgi:Pyridoxamine 5'-phosphate oxidase